ncbi:GntR family transcriptional regulator/MocR family aminotransferase [Paenibacillus mucilaginosus]|uniref:MocR-like pyridoxine biosynthesis transcription factor PdxR n=1 Tax=Paenibacillus mucilaginosus TaxID=61624 RepID=UPI003D248187
MFGFSPAEGAGSMTKQLCTHLRGHIENGTLSPGLRLPPTRRAAQELRIARNIVIEVYEQLTAEGYLVTRTGAGTYVADSIQTHMPVRLLPQQVTAAASSPVRPKEQWIDFDAGTPDLRHFPRKLWSQYLRDVTANEPEHVLDYGDCRGSGALREALVRYLFRVKGIRCSADQIIVTSGTSEGCLLLASAFSDLFRTVYAEEPTIGFIADIFRRLHYAVHPVEVDGHGMIVGQMDPSLPRGLLILTPSHQYPTGSILSIQRRQQAVRLAETCGHYILEDDYNSEFRHKGSPIPPLQLLAPSRVIYAGTFSKTLSPAVKLGFLLVPPDLVDRVLQTKADLNLSASGLTQLALSRFIEDGHFDRHIHKMRGIYRKRRIFLKEQVQRLFGGEVQVLGDEAGMHVQLAFRPEVYGAVDWKGSEAFGVRLSSFDEYARHQGRHPGKIVLGYGKLSEEQIAEGLRRLHAFVQSAKSV